MYLKVSKKINFYILTKSDLTIVINKRLQQFFYNILIKYNDILRNETSKISLSTKGVDGSEVPEISEENRIIIPINLSGASIYTTNNNVLIEKVIIKALSETRTSAGSIVIGGETYTYDESNVNKGA